VSKVKMFFDLVTICKLVFCRDARHCVSDYAKPLDAMPCVSTCERLLTNCNFIKQLSDF